MPTTRKYLQAVASVFPVPFTAAQVLLNSHHNPKPEHRNASAMLCGLRDSEHSSPGM